MTVLPVERADTADPPRPVALTVEDVLALPQVQRGHPNVLAGRAGLGREVRWAHVLELSSVAGLLRGGELVLLTGVALPDSNDGLRRWVNELHTMAASAIVIQLGERWARLPAALVHAADRAGLPLVGLRTAVPFVDITRAVLTSVVHSSYAELEMESRVHEVLHRAALDGRTDADVVALVSGFTGSSVVLENRGHRVLAATTPPERDAEAALRDWESRSRRDGAGECWVVGEVRARGRSWGRIIVQLNPQGPASRLHRQAVERGAEAIALRRLIEVGDGDGELPARARLLVDLAHGRYRSEAEGRLRAEAAGFPMTGRTLVAVAVRDPRTPADRVVDAAVRAASVADLPLLLGPDGAGLVSCPPAQPLQSVRAWAERLRRELAAAVVGVAGPVQGLTDIRGALPDAVGAARAEAAAGGRRAVVGLPEVRVRGLLAQLVDDSRLQAFVERELGPVLAAGAAGELAALRAYLAEGRNKSAAAQSVQVSRPAFYARLGRAATLLDADLDDAEQCLSLQLALLAHDMAAASRAAR
jgi:purine catabolism regulator